jgi:hypothetical protein
VLKLTGTVRSISADPWVTKSSFTGSRSTGPRSCRLRTTETKFAE